MITPNIQIKQVPVDLSRPSKNRENYAPQNGIGKKIHVPKEEPSEWVSGVLERGSKSHIAFNNLQALNTGLNAVAMNIRIADRKMEDVTERINRMKDELSKIQKKYYPPYLNGKIETTDVIKKYQALQKQIDQLTIPPPNGEALSTLPTPENISETGNLGIIGTEGDTMPILSEETTYEQINRAIEKLDIGKKKIGEKREALASESLELRKRYDEIFKSADIGESEAEYKSMEMKQGLNIEPGMSLTEAQSQLLALLQ